MREMTSKTKLHLQEIWQTIKWPISHLDRIRDGKKISPWFTKSTFKLYAILWLKIHWGGLLRCKNLFKIYNTTDFSNHHNTSGDIIYFVKQQPIINLQWHYWDFVLKFLSTLQYLQCCAIEMLHKQISAIEMGVFETKIIT